jgi:hypothetical protein
MTRILGEADWRTLRRVHPLALERYCERVLGEIGRVTYDGTRTAHQRYLEIFKIIEHCDREMASIFDDPKRSNALSILARMRSAELMMEEEFLSRSPETRSAVEFLLAGR